jgi:hypothetical protein
MSDEITASHKSTRPETWGSDSPAFQLHRVRLAGRMDTVKTLTAETRFGVSE